MNTYTDRYLRDRVQIVIQAQAQGKLVVDSSHSGLGIPCKEDLGVKIIRGVYPHDYQVDEYGFLDYDREIGLYVFVAKPGGSIPPILAKYPKLVLAEAVVDKIARTIQIQNADEVITFSFAPVWDDGYSLLRDINTELSHLQTGVIVWKLDWSENSITSKAIGPLPRLINAHAQATLTGFAFDPETHVLVYAGCVGYKTSLESLRASLITNKPLSLVRYRESDQTLLPEDRYEVVWQALPEFTSHHSCFVCRTALPGKWEPEDLAGYLVIFDQGPISGDLIEKAFIERLGETLNIPVQANWAHPLWKFAHEQNFVNHLVTWGDCYSAAKINLQAEWQQLIEALLASGEIVID